MSAAAEVSAPVAKPLPKWAELVLTREPARAQALFRIAIGACVLISLGSVIVHGDVAALWLDPAHGGYRAPEASWLFALLGGAGPTQVREVLGASLVAGALLVLGLGGRATAVLALVGYQAVVGLNRDAGGSYDPLMTNALWLLVLADSTATLSLDCRLRTGRWTSEPTVLAFPRWLALYQLVLMYFTTGIQKLSDTWIPFGNLSAVYYVMQQPTWHRAPMAFLAHAFPVTQVATLAVWVFEVSAPLLLVALWLQRRGRLARLPVRRAWAAFGLALHLGIALTLVLGAFPWLAMAFYLSLWVPAHRA